MSENTVAIPNNTWTHVSGTNLDVIQNSGHVLNLVVFEGTKPGVQIVQLEGTWRVREHQENTDA